MPNELLFTDITERNAAQRAIIDAITMQADFAEHLPFCFPALLHIFFNVHFFLPFLFHFGFFARLLGV
jgi:hypothetical protein